MQDIIMQGNLNGFETVRKMGNDPEKSGHMLQRNGKIYFNIFWYTSPKPGWLGLVTSYIRNKNCILDPLGVGAGDGRNIILSSQWQIVGAATKRFYWTWVWPLLGHSFSYTLTCVLGCKCVSVFVFVHTWGVCLGVQFTYLRVSIQNDRDGQVITGAPCNLSFFQGRD